MQTMSTTSKSTMPCSRYHDNAFQFVFQSLHHAQKILDRIPPQGDEEEVSHISGQELLRGVRSLAISQFGLMARMVFRHWGVRSTTDFGHIVFELIERGELIEIRQVLDKTTNKTVRVVGPLMKRNLWT